MDDETIDCEACGSECPGTSECTYCYITLCSDCASEYSDCCSRCFDARLDAFCDELNEEDAAAEDDE